MKHSQGIKRDFPNIYYAIVITLQVLLYQEDIYAIFTYIDKQKISNYVTFIKNIEIKVSREVFKQAFVEARIFN